jgi:hypothetical protein
MSERSKQLVRRITVPFVVAAEMTADDIADWLFPFTLDPDWLYYYGPITEEETRELTDEEAKELREDQGDDVEP